MYSKSLIKKMVKYIFPITSNEIIFFRAVCREFGIHIGRLCLVFLLFSPGMFISSTAFLPSSFAMYMFMGACAAWWGRNYNLAVFFTALGSLLGKKLDYMKYCVLFEKNFRLAFCCPIRGPNSLRYASQTKKI